MGWSEPRWVSNRLQIYYKMLKNPTLKAKTLLEESNLVDEGTALYEDKDADDVWKDRIKSAVQTLLHEAVAHYHPIPVQHTNSLVCGIFAKAKERGKNLHTPSETTRERPSRHLLMSL